MGFIEDLGRTNTLRAVTNDISNLAINLRQQKRADEAMQIQKQQMQAELDNYRRMESPVLWSRITQNMTPSQIKLAEQVYGYKIQGEGANRWVRTEDAQAGLGELGKNLPLLQKFQQARIDDTGVELAQLNEVIAKGGKQAEQATQQKKMLEKTQEAMLYQQQLVGKMQEYKDLGYSTESIQEAFMTYPSIDKDKLKLETESVKSGNISDERRYAQNEVDIARLSAIQNPTAEQQQELMDKQNFNAGVRERRRAQYGELYNQELGKGRGSTQAQAEGIPVQEEEAARTSEAAETSKLMAQTNVEQFNAAQAAEDNIAKIDNLIKHINESESITGLGAEIFKNIERVKTLFGDEVAAGRAIDTEILDAMLGSEVFPMIKALGIGARGLDTPAEREFMRKVLTGSITLNKQTLLQMAEIRKAVSQRAIDRWNKRTRSGELKGFYRTQQMEPRIFGNQENKDYSNLW